MQGENGMSHPTMPDVIDFPREQILGDYVSLGRKKQDSGHADVQRALFRVYRLRSADS